MKRVLLAITALLALFSCEGNKGADIEIKSKEDIAGLRVATIAGSSYDRELSSRTDILLQLYNTDSDVLQALLNGKADVAVSDEVVINSEIRIENGIKIAFRGDQFFPTSFMFNKDQKELADAMSDVIHRMQEDGSMQRLKDFWLTDRFAEAESFPRINYNATGEPIRVATITSSAPISFTVGGEWFGIEVDILRELGKALNRPIDIQRLDPTGAFISVKKGMTDVMCGCVFITPEREKEFMFADPYHLYGSAYFVIDPKAKSGGKDIVSGLIHDFDRNMLVENRWKYIMEGLWETLKISVLAILLGSVLGIFLFAMSKSRRKWLRSLANLYNGFMAGIPELVLLLILYYVVFAKAGIPPDSVAVIAFALFFASAASDIYRSSLEAVPVGQTEAGLALGFTPAQTFFNIVMPQAVRNGLPLFRGQCVSLLKGTSIVGYIAIHDLTRAGDLIRSRTFDAMVPLLVVTILYFVLVWLIGALITLAAPKKKVL